MSSGTDSKIMTDFTQGQTASEKKSNGNLNRINFKLAKGHRRIISWIISKLLQRWLGK